MKKNINLLLVFSILFTSITYSQKSNQQNDECKQFGNIGTLNFEELNYLTLNYEKIKFVVDISNHFYRKTGFDEINNLNHSNIISLNKLKCALKQTSAFQLTSDTEGVFNDKNIQTNYNELTDKNYLEKIEILNLITLEQEKLLINFNEFQNKIENPIIKKLNKYLICNIQNGIRSGNQFLINLKSNYTPKHLTLKEFNKILRKKNQSCNIETSIPAGSQQGKGNGQGKGKGMGKGKY